jgi:hypothetical protein
MTFNHTNHSQNMKQIAKSVLKGLLVVVLFTSGSVALSTTGVQTVSEASAASYNQVYEYLLTEGYTVISMQPKPGTKFDWVAQTVKNQVHYITTIYCTETCVIGNSDVSL